MVFPIGDYSTSARAVVNNMNAVFKASRDYSFNTTAVSNAAIQARAKKRNAVTNAKALGEKTKDAVDTSLALNKRQAKTKEQVSDILRPSKRMAGVVGGLGLMSSAYMTKKMNDADRVERLELRNLRTEQLSDIQRQYSESKAKNEARIDWIKSGRQGTPPGAEDLPGNTSLDSTATIQPVELSKFTPKDFDELSYAISSEAGPGLDRYAVAASIINRVNSPDFPNTVSEVINQPGQYEGVYKGLSNYDQNISSDLQSPTGQKEIMNALTILDGRTDFKGQTQLEHRSNKGNKDGMMDPMFDPKGNFFHYSWQV